MQPNEGTLRFVWWNTQSFGHFVKGRSSIHRWPSSRRKYKAKCERVDSVLHRIKTKVGGLDLVCLSEITRCAAVELRDRLFPGYDVFSLDLIEHSPSFELAVIYDPALSFTQVGPFAVPFQPRGARAMAVLDFVTEQYRIRFIVCHWTAPGTDQSECNRTEVAKAVERFIYDYVHDDSIEGGKHAVVVGDLNEEPFGLLEKWMHSTRSRVRARGPEHYSDQDIRRIRLYNCAWRLLGEVRPHTKDDGVKPSTAGTYYYQEGRTWHTYDQVLVTGSLLTGQAPYFMEDKLQLVCDEELLDEEGRPVAFDWDGRKATGFSDHLPLVGAIDTGRSSNHE